MRHSSNGCTLAARLRTGSDLQSLNRSMSERNEGDGGALRPFVDASGNLPGNRERIDP